jgi:hypothetical protein
LAYGDASTFAAQSFPIRGIPLWNAAAICTVRTDCFYSHLAALPLSRAPT